MSLINLRWCACFAIVIAQALVAFKLVPAALLFFTAGGLLWGYLAWVGKDNPLLFVNVFAMMFNFIGLYNYWLST